MGRFIDLTGKTFTRLTVLSYLGDRGWKCVCSCGKEKTVNGSDLRSGNTKSCGCLLRDKPNCLIDLTGKTFGRLFVLRRILGGKYECRCVCGTVKTINGRYLRDGHTTSCGCYHLERLRSDHTTHGKHETPEFVSWCAMRQRCHDSKSRAYKWYGARGIAVCERWRHSFENFLADMGPKPTPKHTIERIDVNGNYEPSNCKWLERRLQIRNRRNSLFLEFDGERKPMMEWCEDLGMPYRTVQARLSRGWPADQALTVPMSIAP